MSLAIDLHRRRDYPTDEVVAWLKLRSWTIITLASGAKMAAPPNDERGVCDLMDAVLRQVLSEHQYESLHGMRFEAPEPKRTRKERAAGAPADDEDVFR